MRTHAGGASEQRGDDRSEREPQRPVLVGVEVHTCGGATTRIGGTGIPGSIGAVLIAVMSGAMPLAECQVSGSE